MGQTKNAVLQMIIENVLTDLMIRSGSDNIIVDKTTGETLATRLSTIATTMTNFVKQSDVETYVTTKLSELIGGSPETADTLLELFNFISENQDGIEALNSAIGNKVDKVGGKGLSANDFTDTLLAKLNGIATNATKVEASATNGNVVINGSEVQVYKDPTGNGYNRLPAGGSVGQVLRAGGDGTGSWGVAIRSGASAPDNLLAGELFIKLID